MMAIATILLPSVFVRNHSHPVGCDTCPFWQDVIDWEKISMECAPFVAGISVF